MKYTNYFRKKLNSIGPPRLSLEQFKRYLSIIDTERSIRDYNLLGDNSLHSTEDSRIVEMNQRLSKLTNDIKPMALYEELVEQSDLPKFNTKTRNSRFLYRKK